MTDDPTSHFPDHRIVVTEENLDAVRALLPADQRPHIEVGCWMWRMPDGGIPYCDTILTYWPRSNRGALAYDGNDGPSGWGTWHGDKLYLDDYAIVDVGGHIVGFGWFRPALTESEDQSAEDETGH